jgi:hypothetical protein
VRAQRHSISLEKIEKFSAFILRGVLRQEAAAPQGQAASAIELFLTPE